MLLCFHSLCSVWRDWRIVSEPVFRIVCFLQDLQPFVPPLIIAIDTFKALLAVRIIDIRVWRPIIAAVATIIEGVADAIAVFSCEVDSFLGRVERVEEEGGTIIGTISLSTAVMMGNCGLARLTQAGFSPFPLSPLRCFSHRQLLQPYCRNSPAETQSTGNAGLSRPLSKCYRHCAWRSHCSGGC